MKSSRLRRFFLPAQAPEKSAAWYADVLGVLKTPTAYNQLCWELEHGPTVFGPFPADTAYFRDPGKSFMFNFRVADLDALIKPLETAGNTVEVDPEVYTNGRFARFCDPDGDPVAIWQPEDVAATPPESEA